MSFSPTLRDYRNDKGRRVSLRSAPRRLGPKFRPGRQVCLVLEPAVPKLIVGRSHWGAAVPVWSSATPVESSSPNCFCPALQLGLQGKDVSRMRGGS